MSYFCCTGARCCAERSIKIYSNIIRFASTSVEPEGKIIIPRRIKRGPTDILKALSATLSRDTTAAHYKYHDDPFLIPCSTLAKRSFAMAKESGRNAARWIQNQHPELFQHKEAFPFIEEYAPRVVYDENSAVDESTLMKVIRNAEVSNAIKVYELLEKQGVKISNETKQSFLELLCYFNCEDPLSEDALEERWFQQSTKGREKQKKTWKDNGLADKIFLSFEQKDSNSYSAIIQGMLRYGQVERAWQLYEECRDNNVVLRTEVYNALLRVVNFLRESTELRWNLTKELLTEMAEKKIKPNTETLNSVLEGISTLPNQKQSKEYALQALSEFRALNIEPTLTSYYFLLITFCKPRGPTSNILVDIINHIQGKEFTIENPKDTFFFVTAMDVCRNHLQDKDLAYKVDELLHTGNNYILLGDSYKESIYYRHFFVLLSATETIDIFIEFYNKIVPHIYTPEPAVMEEVIKIIGINGAEEYLPRIWSDMVLFGHAERDSTASALLSCMVQNEPAEGSELVEQFGNIAWDLYSRQESIEEDKYKQWRWTGQMLGDVMTILLRADRFEETCKVLDKLRNNPQQIMGVPNIEPLQLYLESCIKEKNVKNAIKCVQYCAEASFPEAEMMARQFITTISLDGGSIAQLSNIIGKDLNKTE